MRCSKIRPELSLGCLLLAVACAAPPAPAAVEPPPPPPAAPPAFTMLDAGAIAAIGELLRMEDRRSLDSVRVAALLTHPEAQVRGRAALAAGRVADRRMTPLLLRALSDSAAYVRASAVLALGEMGDTSATVLRALSDAALAGDTDEQAAVEAVAVLGRLGLPSARETLLRLLAPAEVVADTLPAADGLAAAEPSALVGEALLAIWRLPRSPAAVEAVTRWSDDADPETRWRAAYALMRLADPRSVPRLLALLGDDDALVRALAARGLRAPTADSAGQRAPARAALLGSLDDPHPHVRINALNALTTYGDTLIADRVAAALEDEDGNVAIAAAQALGQVGGDRPARALAGAAADTAAPVARRATALASLVRIAASAGAAVATEWAARDDWLERLYAARALGGAPWAVAGPLLPALARDADPRVAAAALSAIVATADSTASLRPLYIESLASGDAGVRAAATRGLTRRVGPADLDVLLQAYQRAVDDTSNDAALAAVDGLAALARQNVPVARSFFLRFRRSDDPLVRRRVAAAFGTDGWGQPLPIETGRPLDFYMGVARDLVAAELAGVPRPRALIRTAAGTIELELFGADAPLTVHNFMTLAAGAYFRRPPGAGSPARRWHRVVPNFVLQDGDPRGDGTGDPGYAIRDEINRHRYLRGTLGMALAGPDTGGSQFFITHAPQPHLDAGYTVFGRVTAGMDVADAVIQDDPILSIEVIR